MRKCANASRDENMKRSMYLSKVLHTKSTPTLEHHRTSPQWTTIPERPLYQ